MRKKVKRLERRDKEKAKKAEEPKIIDEAFSRQYRSDLLELDKMERQEDNWKAIRKHPVTKVVVVVGITIGLVYVSSFAFNVATKAAISYKKFKKALES